uniref:Putative secreted protein n=1 Tax=Anopheles marajoara TaxID=58244 RepID=A0A2M4CDS8_9DIPT
MLFIRFPFFPFSLALVLHKPNHTHGIDTVYNICWRTPMSLELWSESNLKYESSVLFRSLRTSSINILVERDK